MLRNLAILLCIGCCGCYGSSKPGQYKTKERPTAVVEAPEAPKDGKAVKDNKETKDAKAAEPKSDTKSK